LDAVSAFKNGHEYVLSPYQESSGILAGGDGLSTWSTKRTCRKCPLGLAQSRRGRGYCPRATDGLVLFSNPKSLETWKAISYMGTPQFDLSRDRNKFES
jgi:hypothetical protein